MLTFSVDVGSSFAARFLTLLASQQYADLGHMFLNDGDHPSNLTVIDPTSGHIEVYCGSDIPDALSRAFACVAHKYIVIENVAAHQVSAGVTSVITFKDSEGLISGSISVLLEHCDDESFFVRDASVQVTETVLPEKVPEPVEQATEEPVAAAAVESAPVEAPIEEVHTEAPAEAVAEVAAEEPVVVEAPVESVPTTSKGKKGKKASKAVVEAPVVAVEEVVEAAPVEEPVSAVEEAPAPAPEAAPAVEEVPVKPSGPKSWASLARAPPSANAQTVAPIKVTPPVKEVAAPKEEPVKDAKASRPAPRPEIGDRLVFLTQVEVTDDELKAALGSAAKNVVSLRNLSKTNRVFIDFVAGFAALEKLKDKITLKGQKVNVQRQKERQQ